MEYKEKKPSRRKKYRYTDKSEEFKSNKKDEIIKWIKNEFDIMILDVDMKLYPDIHLIIDSENKLSSTEMYRVTRQFERTKDIRYIWIKYKKNDK